MRNRKTHDIIDELKRKSDAIAIITEHCSEYPTVTIKNPNNNDKYGIMMVSPFYEPDRKIPEIIMFGSYTKPINSLVCRIQETSQLEDFLELCFKQINSDMIVISMDLS